MATPNPTEVAPWYLRNITQALELDEATGNVFVRTNAALIGNVSVGNVSIGALGNVDLTGNTLPVTVEAGNVTVYQGTDPWMVEGNVVVTSGNVGVVGNIAGITGNIAGITGNVKVVQGTDPWNVSGNVSVTGGNISASLGAGSIDAFGRLRVAEPYTLFDSAFIGSADNGKFDTALTGTGSTSYDVYSSAVSMTVGTASGDQVVRQSYRTFPYQPGKALEIFETFAFANSQPNLRQRIGYFTAYNGVYLEDNGGTYYLVIRKQTGSSTYTETRVQQSSWNIDPLNGAGPSGIDINLSKVQILYTAIEWLGVGSVFCGFIIEGTYYFAHRFDHANIDTSTYMQSAQQSIRLEITNTGTTTGASMKQICSSVISSGGYAPSAEQQFTGRGLTYYTMSTAGTFYNSVSLRLGTDGINYNKVVYLDNVNVLSDSNQNMQWRLILNPTFSVAPTWSNVTTFTQSTTSNVTVTGGTVLGSGYVVNKGEPVSLAGDLFRWQIGRTIAGNSDVLCVCVTADSNNVKLGGDVGFFEI